MARRRNSKESPADSLVTLPWWVSVAVGVVVFILLKWIAPAAWEANKILKPLATVLSGFAWIPAGFFFLIGALSFARERIQEKRGAPATKWTSGPVPTHEHLEPVFGGDQTSVAWPAGDQTGAREKPTEWSVELLRELEWKRFEDVCQKFHELNGVRCETTPLGPDGGVDIRLYQDDSAKATAIAQCKAWGDKSVGVKPVRELLGVMAHEKIEKAYFMASGGFTDDAKAFASENRITLVSGDTMVSMIKRMPADQQEALLAFATEGDYTTPTCPSCGIKMRHVPGTGGRQDFWGCRNYPRCRQKLWMRAADRS